VSITDHAQESLGDVVFVELPAVGSKVLKGSKCPFFFNTNERVSNASVGQIGAVESVKAASDIVESSITL
jgi:glycine cleavage system H protein